MDFNQELYNLCYGIREQMLITLNKNYPESKANADIDFIKDAVAKHKANPRIPKEIITALESAHNYVTNISSSYFNQGC